MPEVIRRVYQFGEWCFKSVPVLTPEEQQKLLPTAKGKKKELVVTDADRREAAAHEINLHVVDD